MFAKIKTAGLKGLDGFMVDVEADVQNGLPGIYLTGALSPETKEAQYRVMNALRNSGFRMEPRKITVNFSPASERKEGTGYDLPIAAAILAAQGAVSSGKLERTALVGETGLDGSLKKIRGVLPLAFFLRENGIERIIVPSENAAEASLAAGVDVIGCSDLREAVDVLWQILQGEIPEHSAACGRSCSVYGSTEEDAPDYPVDFSEVRGQDYLKRAAEIAVSGRHNILFSGPAGTGKTMIARRMPTIMPRLSREENIEISKIYSICGLLPGERPLLSKRPFRSPHHGISEAAFAGGGSRAMPGEMSLASGGILFLDELPLFRRDTLEMLRQPMEDRKITVTRMKGSCTYPADFLLAGAMNNCACGFYPGKRCTCSKAQIKAYMGRLSKPLLERIDICAEARPVSYGELSGKEASETSARIRGRVEEVTAIQKARFQDCGNIRYNSQMGIREIGRFCVLGREEQDFMRETFQAKSLSGRTYHKILKVARTIADMDGSDVIRTEHLAEAVELRSIEDSLFAPAGHGRDLPPEFRARGRETC